MASERRPFRFVHTADLHLDSPLELRADSVIGRLGGATRQALTLLVDLCIEESVDALMIAGDLFDGDIRTAETLAHLTQQMRRLRDANIQVFIIYGNHDRKSGNERSLELPDNVHVFDGRGKPADRPELDVAVHGVSFAKRHEPESLLPKYRKPIDQRWNIGLMHTSIDGSQDHDVYAPCALKDLVDHGYDYWALGHIHQRRVHSEQPAVVMAGIPQGRHINEAGACSVTLVTLNEGQAPQLEERHVRVAAFETLPVEVSGASDRSEVLDIIDNALAQRMASCDEQMLLLRLSLTGQTEAAFSLYDNPVLLENEIFLLAERHEDLSIEKIRLDLQLPNHDSHEDEALPIDALFSKDVLGSSAVSAMIDAEFEGLKKHLPAAYRSILGESSEEQDKLKASLLEQGVTRVKARLVTGRRDEN